MKILRLLIKILPILYMSFIWYLSSRPSDAVINTGLTFDSTLKESLHFVEFAILYGLWLLAFLTKGMITPKDSKLAALLAIAYGLIDEIHQYFVPDRSATFWDLTKDAIGVAISMYIINKLLSRQDKSKLYITISKLANKITAKTKDQLKKPSP